MCNMTEYKFSYHDFPQIKALAENEQGRAATTTVPGTSIPGVPAEPTEDPPIHCSPSWEVYVRGRQYCQTTPRINSINSSIGWSTWSVLEHKDSKKSLARRRSKVCGFEREGRRQDREHLHRRRRNRQLEAPRRRRMMTLQIGPSQQFRQFQRASPRTGVRPAAVGSNTEADVPWRMVGRNVSWRAGRGNRHYSQPRRRSIVSLGNPSRGKARPTRRVQQETIDMVLESVYDAHTPFTNRT